MWIKILSSVVWFILILLLRLFLQVRDSAPPFRVLEKCQELCLRDRTATNNLVRTCTSFDFQPGSRIASFSGAAEYEESTCYLTREQAQPEGIGNLMLVPNSVHFTEVCLTCKLDYTMCIKYLMNNFHVLICKTQIRDFIVHYTRQISRL